MKYGVVKSRIGYIFRVTVGVVIRSAYEGGWLVISAPRLGDRISLLFLVWTVVYHRHKRGYKLLF